MTRWPAWAAALRIARRDAWRHKGRSVLVLVMIGLPVAAIVFGAVAFRTLQLSPEQEVTTQIGTTADGWVSRPSGHTVFQSPPLTDAGNTMLRRLRGPAPTIEELVPTGSRVIPTKLATDGADVQTEARWATPSIRELEYTDPLAAGMVEQVTGRSPEASDEVVVTETLAETLSVNTGNVVQVADRPYDVVGTVRLPYAANTEQVIGDPRAFPQVRSTSDIFNGGGAGWLVEVPGGLDYDRWKGINAMGSTVISRSVAASPPTPCSLEIPSAVRNCSPGPVSSDVQKQVAQTAALVGLLVGMALLQVILMVGPAFAIGRRRQAHDLALVAAVGGDAKAVRRVVLSGGLVLGLAGGLAGLVVGLALFQGLRPLISRLTGTDLFATDIHAELLAVLVVALITGLTASWLPARQAARQDVVATLAGRRGVARGSRRIPVAGGAAIVAGTSIAFFGAAPGNAVLLLFGCAIAELGLVAMAPTVVGWASRLGARMPTAPRFALRDAGRNRMRAGTAVAAVLAAVAGATALGIYIASEDSGFRDQYFPDVPEDYAALRDFQKRSTAQPTANDAGVVAAIAGQLPTEAVVDMRGLGSRTGDCTLGRCGPWHVTVSQGDQCSPRKGELPQICYRSSTGFWPAWSRGDATTYLALTGQPAEPAVADTLEQGGVIVTGYSASYIRGDSLELTNRRTGEVVTLPATVAPNGGADEPQRYEILFSPQAADALDLPVVDWGVTFITSRAPTSAELAAARSEIPLPSESDTLYQGLPYSSDVSLGLLLLLSAAALIALVAGATAVGLAGADARPDMSTLAAIGAPPRVRRWISAFYALVVTGLGTVLGLAGGLVIGIAATRATAGEYLGEFNADVNLPLTVPWVPLTWFAVGLPLISVVLAWLFTRSDLPISRRLT